MDEDEIQEPKPLVEYAMLPDDEEINEEPDILDIIAARNKIPLEFGKNMNLVNTEVKDIILDHHRVKAAEKVYVPYEIDLEEEALIGPPIPKNYTVEKEGDDESSEENDENEELIKTIPSSHVVELNHTVDKSLTTLDLDRAGNRLITGSADGTVKIWDFTSMTRRPSAFHTVQAGVDYPVVSLNWASSGGFFVAATGDCQAKIYDRDGNFEIGCLKGDSYLHDIQNTKGHTYPLTDAKWHPSERHLFITSSRDSTVRIWDIYSKPMGLDQEIMQATVLKAKTMKNHKIPVNCCSFSNDGKLILAGVNDGSLQIWSQKSNHWKPDIYIPEAHKFNSEITSVLMCEDNLRFFSRGDDSTLRMWDLRNANKPLKVWEDIPCFSTKTGMTLSPDESMIITGTCVKKGHENSSINFYSTYNYEKIKELNVCRSSITSILWNSKLNQIAVGSTDGKCRMYFSPELSQKGIVNTIFKKAKTRDIDDINYVKPIITPLVLPLFDEVNFDRKTYMDIISPTVGPASKADLPLQGPGSRFARAPSVTAHIMQNLHKKLYADGDAREMLLKFGSKNNEGEWVDSAYKQSQPKPIFDLNPRLEDEVLYLEQKKRNRCHGCGLKFCTCKKTIFQLPIPKVTPAKNINF